MQVFMQYLPHCFFVNGHPLCYQSNTKPTIFSNNFLDFSVIVSGFWCGWASWTFIIFNISSAFMKSFVPFQNAGSWHAFFAVNFHPSVNFTKNFKVNSLLSFRVKHFSAALTELLATMSNLLLLQAKVFSDAQKNVHLLSTSRHLICLKYNSNFACNLSENCRLQSCAFLTSHSQKKTYSFIFLRQILSCYNFKISFSKLVKVLVLEVFCGTRTRKLSTRLHHWFGGTTPLGDPQKSIFDWLGLGL